MKRILCAVLMMVAIAAPSEAANRSQYSPEPPSLLDEILGTDEVWTATPQPQPQIRLRGRHRRYVGFNPPQPQQRPQPSVAYTYQDPGVSSSLVAYGRQLQAAGYRVSEHPAFGGVHHVHHGWAHYAGRAIDINIGRGIKEAYNPATRARFDALAAQARAAGYTVLWKVAGHYDHIHIQR